VLLLLLFLALFNVNAVTVTAFHNMTTYNTDRFILRKYKQQDDSTAYEVARFPITASFYHDGFDYGVIKMHESIVFFSFIVDSTPSICVIELISTSSSEVHLLLRQANKKEKQLNQNAREISLFTINDANLLFQQNQSSSKYIMPTFGVTKLCAECQKQTRNCFRKLWDATIGNLVYYAKAFWNNFCCFKRGKNKKHEEA
jgi:hypothetical protein